MCLSIPRLGMVPADTEVGLMERTMNHNSSRWQKQTPEYVCAAVVAFGLIIGCVRDLHGGGEP